MLAITMLPVNMLAHSGSAAPAQLSAATAGGTSGNPAGSLPPIQTAAQLGLITRLGT
ncbi:hypothetical protein [Syntrophomonas palmitatica]|uniref:hypothetical protein n=1 Tax=Syntrophomonas palmitatica TaxID=402877 RepID=UPI00155DA814|nr:hypothetical protein [Syntrophomonas palmitatica]